MSLRKPYKGKKPTALFISKYPIFSKRGNQEVYRMIPFTQVLKKKVSVPIPSFKSNSMTDDEKEALEAGVTVRDYDENEKIVSTQPILKIWNRKKKI